MILNDRKFLIAVIAIIATTVLIFGNKIDAQQGLVLISSVTMYILGNGIAAYRGKEATPVVKPRVVQDRRQLNAAPPD